MQYSYLAWYTSIHVTQYWEYAVNNSFMCYDFFNIALNISLWLHCVLFKNLLNGIGYNILNSKTSLNNARKTFLVFFNLYILKVLNYKFFSISLFGFYLLTCKSTIPLHEGIT